MCLYVKRDEPTRRSEKAMKAFKIYRYWVYDGRWKSPFQETVAKSVSRGTVVSDVGTETYRHHTYDTELDAIEGGMIHAYTSWNVELVKSLAFLPNEPNVRTAVFEMRIPKGTEHIVSVHDDEVCAKEMVFVRKVCPLEARFRTWLLRRRGLA